MIVLQALCRQFGDKVVFGDISAAFDPRCRYALIGRNGSGKTLLLRTLAGEEHADSGGVSLPSKLRLGYLPQEMDLELQLTPLQLVLSPFSRWLDEHAAHDEHAPVDVAALPSRAKALLAGLGVAERAWERDLRELSGGYRMRVVLARLLLEGPDFLLLDEPTNHLDFDSLVWLERFLGRFKGGMLVVSHDRAFLGRVTDRTAELRGGAMTLYNGVLDRYFEWRSQQELHEQRRVANIEAQIAQNEAFVRRFKAKNTKAAAARSKMKVIERLREQLPGQQVVEEDAARFRLPQAPRAGTVVLKLDGVSVGYGGPPVLAGLDLSVGRNDRVAIIGPNGAGKSTLLKLCAGLLAPQAGSITPGANVVSRYYSQHRLDQLDGRLTLYQTVAGVLNTSSPTAIQTLLGAFLFSGDEVEKTVSVLSGGEKSRLSLATIFASPGNLLLLDEPTNHLDVETVENLASALEGYQGAMLLVSHDEYLVNRIANRIFEMRPGRFRDFPGTLADYRSYIEEGYLAPLEAASVQAGEAEADLEAQKQERIRRREERKRLERRIEKAEREISLLEEQMAHCRETLESPANATQYQLLGEAQLQLGQLGDEHERAMGQWHGLQEELEQVAGEE